MALPTPDPRPLVTQPSRRPTRKVSAGIAGGGAAGFVLWLLELVGLPPMEPAVAAWVATAVGAAVAWFVRDRKVYS